MQSKDILALISRVGSNGYQAEDNGDGTADIEVTAAQGTKLMELFNKDGADNAKLVELAGAHVVINVNIQALKDAAAKSERTRSGSSVKVDITSRIVYAVDAPDANNQVTEAWWESSKLTGGITVNGIEYAIFAGEAGEYYAEPDESKAAEWNPDRTVYVVNLPTDEGELVLTSYGVTNLIRRVASRNEQIV